MRSGLIIGASSGIGAAIRMRIAETGFGLEEDCEWHTPDKDDLDVRYSNSVRNYIAGYGPFKYIVYSAGVNQLGWVSQLARRYSDMLENMWEVNCAGFIRVMACQEAAFPMAGGSALAISSDAARRPMRGSVAYCSSKAALDIAVRTMARELAPRWRVNAISPGITADTNMTEYLDENIPGFRGWTAEFAREYEQGQIPMKRRAAKAEIAEIAVTTLAGPEYLTGAIIEVNGGR